MAAATSGARRVRPASSSRITGPRPRSVPAAYDGAPMPEPTSIVECNGLLYDRVVCFTPHVHKLHLPGDPGPLLRMLFTEWWKHFARDEDGLNLREQRAAISELVSIACSQKPSAALDRRRAWRYVDWSVHVKSPALFEFGGFPHHAAAYRALPAITGPELPPGAYAAFHAAYRETDAASSAALKRTPPYASPTYLSRDEKDARRERWFKPRLDAEDLITRTSLARRLPTMEWVIKTTVPGLDEHLREMPRQRPLSRGLSAAVYAEMVGERDSRIPVRRHMALRDEIAAAKLEVVRELVHMRDARAAKAA